jgi:hypothetical protein
MLNFLLSSLMKFVVVRIGLKTISETNMQLCQFVFISQFINTGIIGLLSNADFSATPLKFIPINRKYPDFNENWFIDFGASLTQTMCIQSIMPYVNVIIVIVTMKLNKFLKDGKISSIDKITETKAYTM